MKKNVFRHLALFFLGVAVLTWLAVAHYPGFAVFAFLISVVFAFLYGFKNIKKDFLNTKKITAFIFSLFLSIFLLLSFVYLVKLPNFDFSRQKQFTLQAETKRLLKEISEPLKMEVNLASSSLADFRIRELLKAFASENNFITYKINNADYKIVADDEISLVESNTVIINYKNINEAVETITEKSLYEGFAKVSRKEIYKFNFLTSLGEKSLIDKSNFGLSNLEEHLFKQNIYAKDYLFLEQTNLLNIGADVLFMAGPIFPLGEAREKEILKYLANGGRLMLMVDPLNYHFSDEFWEALGIKYFKGLVIDPDLSLENSDHIFVLANSFPQHEITQYLKQPILFPAVGAFGLSESEENEGNRENEKYKPLENEAHILAVSSSLSWLETDFKSLQNNNVKYDKETDLAGPLALALALEVENTNENANKSKGRLVLVADSDFASNYVQKYIGNTSFLTASINWLLNKDKLISPLEDRVTTLKMDKTEARLSFWLPVLVWPVLIIFLWFLYYKRRKN